MNTKQTGDETEATILAALIAMGHSVSIPFGDNDKYDLLLDTGTRILRVQCKTGWVEGDVIRFKTASKTTVDGTDTVVDYDDTIDGFAVRCRETDELYWVPMEDAGKKSTYLRIVEPEIEHPSTKRESDYRLEKRL
ncbi:group I intron-associated PD-(D/E)XK endonuclease [Natronosalvus halobius]|uniref:group I intron-associated PD-(D/E)XK endonuclease n=1 Tax=Natronosalvus halobius TaxID=2953746 RepID=UPI00209D881A|nr:group I intron-associated PD-(D/E)XK endonuclease [Natronosalvus halobius]USZ71362.1 group I intron-associated PD-(D/E)XK endonuclease [Natronosalvus halobius]